MAKKIKAKKVIKALRAGQGYAYATKTKIWGDDEAQKVDYGNVGEYFEKKLLASYPLGLWLDESKAARKKFSKWYAKNWYAKNK